MAKNCKSGRHVLSSESDWVLRNGNAKQCRECWKETHRRGNLRRNYGLTLSDYEDLLEAQNYRCAICKSKAPGGRSPNFHVDHDHETGEVRGLLCSSCNLGLGKFKDDLLILREAVRYLESE